MTRLIDADLLRKNMEFICMGIMAGTDPYDAPLTEIDNAPTVEERTHGKWELHRKDLRVWFECSNCGAYNGGFETEYCPICGAEMEANNENE